uniref:Uncharacterized protein n=1 Tax=Anguilla anguilla TaxID=7936 RepID=A0A0E9RF21_ANGAN
MHCMSEAEDRQ